MSDNNTNKVVVQFIGDSSQLERAMKRVESSLNNMSESVGRSMFKAMVGFEVLKRGLHMVASATVKGTDDAIRYEAVMDTLGQRLGASSEQFMQWSDSVGRAMGYSKLEGANFANTLSISLSQVATSQQDLTEKTTKMMEVAAIIRAKTGKSQTEVSDRIRSAMNAEADGADELGINVRTSAIEISNAFKTMSDGKAWKDLATSQQKAILYQYILDESARNYGNTLADNTSTRMAVFIASLKDMRLALGQAFLPIVNVALPYLSALVGWITTALGYVRVFFATLFGYKGDGGAGVNAQANAMKGYGGAVDGATNSQNKLNDAIGKGAKASEDANKAKKKTREGLAGFDEINTLPEKSDSSSGGGKGGSGGGGGGDFGLGGIQASDGAMGDFMNKLTEAQLKVQAFAESFKAFMSPIVEVCQTIWNAIVTYVVGVFTNLNEWWSANGNYIGVGFKNLWNNFLYPVLKFLVELIWGSVKGAIDGLVTFFKGLIQFIGGVFSGEWRKAFEGVWMMVKGAFEFIWNIVTLMWMGSIFGAIKGGLAGIGKAFTSFFSSKGEQSVVALVDKGLRAIFDFFKNIFPRSWNEVVYAFSKAGKWLKTNLWTPFANILDDIWKIFKSKPIEWWNGIKNAFTGVKSWFTSNVTQPIKEAFSNISGGAAGAIVGTLKSFVNAHIRPLLNKALDWADAIPGVDISWRMPQLYNGGITNGKTIAQIGDNVGGQEVVAPLDRLNNIIAQTMRSTLAMNSGGTGNGATEIVLKVGSTEFGRVAVDSINKLTKQEGRLALNI